MMIISNKFEIGQKVKSPFGQGIIVEIHIPFTGQLTYLVKVWDHDDRAVIFSSCLEQEVTEC